MSLTRLLIRPETLSAHRARWFVYAGGYGEPLTKIPHTASMRGHWPGWDVTCSCGWESKTGGATRTTVEEMLLDHRLDAQSEADMTGLVRLLAAAGDNGAPMSWTVSELDAVTGRPQEDWVEVLTSHRYLDRIPGEPARYRLSGSGLAYYRTLTEGDTPR